MFRKLLFAAGAGFLAKKLAGRRKDAAPVEVIDRRMHRRGMPGGVRP